MLISRPNYLNKLIQYQDTEFIKVITGVRRCGKSFVLQLFEQHLRQQGIQPEQIISLNFEAPKYFPLHRDGALYEEILTRTQKEQRYYFLFDEIQNVENWQKLVNGLRVEFDCDIYITGSNASLLSGELATHLSGRYVEMTVYPLSFKEFLDFKGITDFRLYPKYYLEYQKSGGFPSVVLQTEDTLKRDVLDGIFDSVLLKDVNLRANIREPEILVRLARFLMANIGQPISLNKITNTLKSQGVKTSTKTIDNYLALLADSFLFFPTKRYDIKGKEYLDITGKYYCIDTGLRNCVISKDNADRGSQLENIVYLELKRRGYQVFVGKYNTKEIDFVALKNGVPTYYQVAYQMPASSTRETDNLLHLPDNYEKILITAFMPETDMIDGVRIINIIDFLLN